MTETNMTATDKLIKGVETFFKQHLAFRFSFCVIYIATLLQIIAYSIPKWLSHESGKQGLWRHCSSITNYQCCKTVENFYYDVPAWLIAVRVFQSFGLIGSVISCICLLVFTCVTSKDSVRRLSLATCTITASCMFIGISIYGGEYRYNPLLEDYVLSVSFIISVIAAIGFAICCLLIFFVRNLDETTVVPTPQPAIPVSQTHYVQPTAPPAEDIYTNSNSTVPQAGNIQPTPYNNEPVNIDTNTCEICFERQIDTMFEPCAHRRCCQVCAESVSICPFCRCSITSRRRVY